MQTNIVIIGLGETGFSCVQYFSSLSIPVVVMDSRLHPPKLSECQKLYPHIPVYTGGFPKDLLQSAEMILLSPGVSKDHPDLSISSKAEIIGDIELFARSVKVPLIAITGSNGKSTVTTLVGEMAKASGIKVGVGGNLGTPVLSLLMKNPALYVLELSSFQLETTISLRPSTATILNLSPDHLDRYPTFEAYRAAKYRIFNHCEQVVFNRQEPLLPDNVKEKKRLISFGLDEPSENQFGLLSNEGQCWLARGKERLLPITDLKLFGRHNLANALAALALGESVDLSMSAMLSVLRDFTGLPHRCEWVRKYQDILWMNDSKGTNVGATLAALKGVASLVPGKWILIAGGVSKQADFTPLKNMVASVCRAVILMGEAKEELYTLLSSSTPCELAHDMEEAVQKALKQAKSDDGVLLSPACASFDMFRNFEARGNAFKEAVCSL